MGYTTSSCARLIRPLLSAKALSPSEKHASGVSVERLLRALFIREDKMSRWKRYRMDDPFPEIYDDLFICGTYVIIIDGKAWYVGQSKKISERMHAHFKIKCSSNLWVTKWGQFSDSQIEIAVQPEMRRSDRYRVEANLILRLKPPGNSRLLNNRKAFAQKRIAENGATKNG